DVRAYKLNVFGSRNVPKLMWLALSASSKASLRLSPSSAAECLRLLRRLPRVGATALQSEETRRDEVPLVPLICPPLAHFCFGAVFAGFGCRDPLPCREATR